RRMNHNRLVLFKNFRIRLIDVETTGLDLQNDEIIELAMISFTYSLDGRIFEVGQTFQHFQEPICGRLCLARGKIVV
ncbi:exonuclease domain-containing protein, partial [Komagataeibacter europaeus]|uniref:exonuclease domain-containing protein n=1 Tax=Komagataeibacter europaeus TaxID=33995 RepID=UPI00223184C9